MPDVLRRAQTCSALLTATRSCSLAYPVAFCTMQGSILMDGVDLLTLGLQEVRGRIAAIPQVRILPLHRQPSLK